VNKDRYNPSHGVPKTCMPLPRGKAVVRSIPAWGDVSSRSRGVFLERAVRPALPRGDGSWLGGSTPPQNYGLRGFRGGESSGFSSGGRGASGWSVRTMCGSRTGGWSLPCVMSD
jgi:hypothetical protein